MIEFVIIPSYLTDMALIMSHIKESLPEWNLSKMAIRDNVYDVTLSSENNADTGIALSRLVKAISAFPATGYKVLSSAEG